MDETTQLLPHSPLSARKKMISSPARPSPLRLSSPSKHHATPSRTRQISPRKSPAKNRVFQSISTKSVSFTPEKTRQPPRAWERRPATPFVARDDKQKIWKRVPLSEIGIDHNRPVSISRRDQEASKDYVRIVKKLKIGHSDGDDDDKENVAISAKEATDDKNPKRAVRFDTRFVMMKAEEDVIMGSPKKKLRTPLVDSHLSLNQAIHDDVANKDYEGEGQDAIGEHRIEGICQHGEQILGVQELSASEDAEPCSDAAAGCTPQHSSEICSSAERASCTTNDCIDLKPVHPRDGSSVDHHTNGEHNVPAIVEALHASENNNFGEETSREATGDEQCTPAQLIEMVDSTSSSVLRVTETDKEESENPATIPEEPRSSSPPTIIADNVVIDELESRTAFKSEESTADQIFVPANRPDVETSIEVEVQELNPRRVSDDEAAFLRNFVSATKAERAAREKRAQEMLPENPVNRSDDRSDPEAGMNAQEEMQEEADEPALEAPIVDSSESISGSPLRRSKRAIITSIPRPQILPNAIQLKRANGNEFIFTANKASSAANVAVVTRSNTKRNKGSALDVTARLEQLLAEEESAQVSEDFNEVIDKVENKKRKREGKDGIVRAKKVLKWNDENLVSYQEAQNHVHPVDDIDDSSQEIEAVRDAGDQESDKHVKLTLTLTSNGPNTQTSEVFKDSAPTTRSSIIGQEETESSLSASKSSQSKVRRVRRGTSGSVNGTPGPKTRSRRVLVEDDGKNHDEDMSMQVPIDTNGSIEDSSAATTAINTLATNTEASRAVATKKSRMPMPVSSGARRGAAASASIRTASNVTSRFVGPLAAPTDVKGDAERSRTRTQTQKEEVKGDVLGKRRLRVRS